MKKPARALLVTVAIVAGGTLVLARTQVGRKVQFVAGGGLVNLGYALQERLIAYDFDQAHVDKISPQQIWDELRRQNDLAASVRRVVPRKTFHPLVAVVACIDARIDTHEMLGDTRRYYYMLRTAGSVLETKEMEMLELAIQNGVKLVVLATHTDCAAEAVAANSELRDRFPALAEAVDVRSVTYEALLTRPMISERIESGELLVKQVRIDTETDGIEER